jgi:hypothetical protein
MVQRPRNVRQLLVSLFRQPIQSNVFVGLAVGLVVGYLVAVLTATPMTATPVYPSSLLSMSSTRTDLMDKENTDGWNNLHIYSGKQTETHFEILTPMSQAKQDVYVAAMLQHQKGGFFVDLAAHDATYLSNTFTLERDHQWNGSTLVCTTDVCRRNKWRACWCTVARTAHLLYSLH